MHKNTTKCIKTQSKWCINKHGASKIIDTFKTYQGAWTLRVAGSNPSSSSSRQHSSRSTVSHHVLRIKTKAGSSGFSSGVEGPEPGYVLCHHYPISSGTRRYSPTSPSVKPYLWLLSSKYHDSHPGPNLDEWNGGGRRLKP
jgi:hypothetical protein